MSGGLNLIQLTKQFSDDEKARAYMERLRWPNGPICPHCGSIFAYPLQAKPGSDRPVRPGVYKCKDCRKQFTVTVGTIFQGSHIPLHKWLIAIHLLCASKKGISAHQLHRMLGITYKSSWFMAHRIRYAMTQPPLVDKLKGTVEVDETYVGGKPRKGGPPSKRGRGTKKTPVVALVERDGRVRSFRVERVTGKNLKGILHRHVDRSAKLMTDEFAVYRKLGKDFASHEVCNHTANEYARGSVHVNSAESFFALLKRGIVGVYHHVGTQHLDQYLKEFDFRYNMRKDSDGERAVAAIKGAEGKRLTYKEPLTRQNS